MSSEGIKIDRRVNPTTPSVETTKYIQLASCAIPHASPGRLTWFRLPLCQLRKSANKTASFVDEVVTMVSEGLSAHAIRAKIQTSRSVPTPRD